MWRLIDSTILGFKKYRTEPRRVTAISNYITKFEMADNGVLTQSLTRSLACLLNQSIALLGRNPGNGGIFPLHLCPSR